MKYDKIIVGAGISGLVTAVLNVYEGKKVLLVDDHNNVGGMANKFRVGRFEFGESLHSFYLNTEEEKNTLNTLLKICGMQGKIEFSKLPSLCRVITKDIDVTLPFGIEAYIDKIESMVSGSKESLEVFFKLAEECKEALQYIDDNLDTIDYDYLKNEYNNFTRISNASVSKVMDAIGVPLKAQEIINTMWLLFGVSETDLSFVTYGVFLYNALVYGLYTVKDGNYDIALCLMDYFLEHGGVLKLNSKVEKILVEDHQVNGIKLLGGACYYAREVVVNSSLRNVYGNMIGLENIPREALKNINKRQVGGRTFTVHLGLNRSALELGLNDSMYFMYDTLDSDVSYKQMKNINSNNQVAIVQDHIDEGTSVISLYTVFMSDVFTKFISNEDIWELEQEIATNLILSFQNYTNVNIYHFIEEIEICSPLKTAMISNIYDGALYDFSLKGMDDLLPRMLNKNKEKYIDGLEIVSGFNGDAFSYLSSYKVNSTEIKSTSNGGDYRG